MKCKSSLISCYGITRCGKLTVLKAALDVAYDEAVKTHKQTLPGSTLRYFIHSACFVWEKSRGKQTVFLLPNRSSLSGGTLMGRRYWIWHITQLQRSKNGEIGSDRQHI